MFVSIESVYLIMTGKTSHEIYTTAEKLQLVSLGLCFLLFIDICFVILTSCTLILLVQFIAV